MAGRLKGPLLLALGLLLAGLAALVSQSASRRAPGAASRSEAARVERTTAGERATLGAPDREPRDGLPGPAEPRSGEVAGERSAAGDPELESARWVSGRVVLPPGTPPGEAVEVEAEGADFEHRPPYRVAVGPDGSFRVAFAGRTRRGRVKVHARHLFDPDPQPFDVRAVGGELPPIELALGGRLEGVVVPPPDATEQERRALAGTEVGIRGPVDKVVRLDERLRFQADALPPSDVYALAVHPKRFVDGALDSLSVEPGRTREVELTLRRGVRISGVLRLEDGSPVEGPSLSASLSGAYYSAVVASNGSFDLAGIRPGEIYLQAGARNALELTRPLGLLGDGATVEGLELVLPCGAAVTGIVLSDGRPTAGVRVVLRRVGEVPGRGPNLPRERGQLPVYAGCESDAEGRFALTGLEPGPYELTARAERAATAGPGGGGRSPGGAAAELIARQVVVAPRAGLVLALGPGASLSGRAVDERGEPVTDFRLRASCDTDSTVLRRVRSDDGRFGLTGLSPGEWRIEASAPGHADSVERAVQVPPGGPLELMLARSPRVSGCVVTPDGDKPDRSARVSVSLAAPPGSPGRRSVLSSSSRGRFELEAPAGLVRIVASAPGLGDSEPLEVELGPAEVLEDLVLRLRRVGRVEGRVKGARVSGVKVQLRPAADGGAILTTHTDAGGRFVFEQVSPGFHDAFAPLDASEATSFERGFRPGLAGLRVEEGGTSRVVLDQDQRVRVLGRVVRGGQPVVGASVYARPPEERSVVDADSSDEEGTFELLLDRSGTYDLLVHDEGPRGSLRRLEVPDVAEHVVVLELGSATVAGTVRTAGQPLKSVLVTLAPEAPGAGDAGDAGGRQRASAWSTTDADGRFELWPEPGPYVLRAEAEGYAPLLRGGIEVVEGGSVVGLELELTRN